MKKYIALTILCLSCKSFANGYLIRNPYDYNSIVNFIYLSNSLGIILLPIGQQLIPYLVEGVPTPTDFFPSHIGIRIHGCFYYMEVLDYFSP